MKRMNVRMGLSLTLIIYFAATGLPQTSVKKRYTDDLFKNVQIHSDINYATALNNSGQNEKLLLDVYSPSSDAETKRICILLFHGGAFYTGKKESHHRIASALAKKGFVVVSANYRLREKPYEDIQSTVLDAVKDGAAAIDWLQRNKKELGIDASRIFIGGDSAGGYLSLCLAYMSGYEEISRQRNHIAGVIDFYGGNVPFSIYPKSVPLLIIHGDRDAVVSIYATYALIEKFKTAGVPCELMIMKGEGHSYQNIYFEYSIMTICTFINRTVSIPDR
jgi:dipeptidyl aminopeptidase/acylaminoacyl peptidase